MGTGALTLPMSKEPEKPSTSGSGGAPAVEKPQSREDKLSQMLIADDLKKDAKADDKNEKPELYDEIFGPYPDEAAAMKKRDELFSAGGFPWPSKTSIQKSAKGYDLHVTFRSRFDVAPPPKEEIFEFVPGMESDKNDQKD